MIVTEIKDGSDYLKAEKELKDLESAKEAAYQIYWSFQEDYNKQEEIMERYNQEQAALDE